MSNQDHILSADAHAILLLCSGLGATRSSVQALTPKVYSDFATWLHGRGMRPAALLTPSGQERLQDHPESARLLRLLDRGTALGLAVERWANQGVWVLARSDADYPQRLKTHLKHGAPPLLYGAGDRSLLSRRGVAIVGARNVDEDGLGFTRELGRSAALRGETVISGCAKGVDQTAMQLAMAHGGHAVGVLPQGVAGASRQALWRKSVRDGRLVLVSIVEPDAGFTGGNAMARNRYIYTLADAAVVVASGDSKRSGTWSGATENLRRGWVPLFVRTTTPMLAGNQSLLERGGRPLENPDVGGVLNSPPTLTTTAIDALKVTTPTPALDETATSHPSDLTEAAQATTDLFPIVWPHLKSHLTEPRTAKEMATLVSIVRPQATAWLDRAASHGLVSVSGRQRRYALVPAHQLSLMKLDGHRD